MTALLLDGRALARILREEIRTDVRQLLHRSGRVPQLAVIHLDGDPASERYLRTIEKSGADVGINVSAHRLPADTTQTTLEALIRGISADPKVSGVLLHVPLPPGLDAPSAIAQIDPRKDVDGVHPVNAGRLLQGLPCLIPNTPAGGMELLRRANIPLHGRHAVVVGRSMVVGKPMALLLLQEHATVTIAHSRTPNLPELLRTADIVAAAVGKPGLITGDMLKPGAVVVDFGMNVLENGKVVGDVDFAGAAEVASAITPVPGGTGPVTNMMLLRNVVQTAGA